MYIRAPGDHSDRWIWEPVVDGTVADIYDTVWVYEYDKKARGIQSEKWRRVCEQHEAKRGWNSADTCTVQLIPPIGPEKSLKSRIVIYATVYATPLAGLEFIERRCKISLIEHKLQDLLSKVESKSILPPPTTAIRYRY